MPKFLQKVADETADILQEIKAGDILGVYATIYAVIFVGVGLVVAQAIRWLGLAIIVISPVPILALTILTKMALNRIAENRRVVKRDAKLRFEEYRDVGEGLIGLTIFNDDDPDLEEKTAELIGFAHSKIGDKLMNSIDMIPHERRILQWYETDSKIASGGHSLTFVSRIDWMGVHFCNLTLQHISDFSTWWAGVEIRGKMNGNPIIARRCCLSFKIGKNVIDNNRVVWLVGHPTLETNDCDWAVSLRGEEVRKWFEENEQKNPVRKLTNKPSG